MAQLRLPALLLLLCTMLASAAFAAPPVKGGGPAPSAREKCPVCGMFVAKFPDWVASSRLKDGTVSFFDGPKDMFSHYLELLRYAKGKKQVDAASMTVKEYYSLKSIEAKNAFFVIGSDVHGPMGSELVPFSSRKDAEEFMADHKGKRIVRFGDITQQILQSLR